MIEIFLNKKFRLHSNKSNKVLVVMVRDLAFKCVLAAMLILVAQGASLPCPDLKMSAVARAGELVVAEVPPGQIFNYNVTINNSISSCDASNFVFTDILPGEAVYIGAQVCPCAEGDWIISRTGNTLEVRIGRVPKNTMRFINITLKAPKEAPVTLYNMMRWRYADQSPSTDNTLILDTYVPLPGYNKTAAIKSFEELLHGQAYLLFSFSDLLNDIPRTRQENYTFMASYEQLLRAQANLTERFAALLSNQQNSGWDKDLQREERTYLLKSYESQLRDEAFLFAAFEAKITDSWLGLSGYSAQGHSMDAQWEFLASLEDLLKRQVTLFRSLEKLLKEIDEEADPQDRQDLVNFLASFEDLLRLESNLLISFEELLFRIFKRQDDIWNVYSRIQGWHSMDELARLD
jgi:uncharacterized repeat protein (TIGR01451 family)